jgi:hypothetical protein
VGEESYEEGEAETNIGLISFFRSFRLVFESRFIVL